MESSFVLVGGGVSAVSCLETIQILAPDQKIILITESSLIKSITNLVRLGKYAQRFEIEEVEGKSMTSENVKVIYDRLTFINSRDKFVETLGGLKVAYKFLCLCTGALPTLINRPDLKDYIIGIRDTETVKEFQKRIKMGKKFCLLGNGGIASEIAHEIDQIRIEWVIKDNHVSSTFVDPAAAKFLESKILDKKEKPEKTILKRMRFGEGDLERPGAALGPDWHRLLDMTGNLKELSNNIKIHFNCEVKSARKNAETSEFALSIELTNGETIECDFIVSATGVHPLINFNSDQEFKLGPDGGIFVDEKMSTSINSIYAAGDVAYAGWEHSKYWFQMRLWTQARQMGMMAGKSIVAAFNGEEIYQDFCFELFSHVTKLYGYQVVLLGKYNGQGLNDQYEILLRITPDQEFVKFVMVDGKLHGALLIGETGLEETCENLILNQIDLTPYGDDILDPNIDIEDYFD
jgi:NAD(P)H-nitrite reductase large subunit